jgi:hypothetical protein
VRFAGVVGELFSEEPAILNLSLWSKDAALETRGVSSPYCGARGARCVTADGRPARRARASPVSARFLVRWPLGLSGAKPLFETYVCNHCYPVCTVDSEYTGVSSQ